MLVNNRHYTTIQYDENTAEIHIIDQTLLPHRFQIATLATLDDFCTAIATMQVRGAPLIGATAAYGLAFALAHDPSPQQEQAASEKLLATRPTAINLHWAISQVRRSITNCPEEFKASTALQCAHKIRSDDIDCCIRIAAEGARLIKDIHNTKNQAQQPVNILTHCNAGWLATVDWGTALAPIYKAHADGIPVHVWVDETRPRNQGASLTAWELHQQGIPHTVIADNTGGHLMQHKQVDCCIVGSDRTTASGDVCNKIGTYLKALAATDNNIPFYVALPTSTIDWTLDNGIEEIPIEQRSEDELRKISGLDDKGRVCEVALFANSSAANYAFDVTPSRLVTALITEQGIIKANPDSLQALKITLENSPT